MSFLKKIFPSKHTKNIHEEPDLSSAITLKDLTAKDIMIPQGDIIWFDETATLKDVENHILSTPHTRFPVCRGTLDKIIGFVSVKDILAMSASKNPFTLSAHIKKPLFVSPSMPCINLLLSMRNNKTYLAIVVDEFGGTDGLVAVSDLLNTIMDTYEEDDTQAPQDYVDLEDGTILVNGRVLLEDFTRHYGIDLLKDIKPTPDIETLGGLVMHLTPDIPDRGEIVQHPSGLVFEVVESTPRTVKRLKIHNVQK